MSNLFFSYGIVYYNGYDDSTKIYLAYNDSNPIELYSSFRMPEVISQRYGEFAGVGANVIAHLPSIQAGIDFADESTDIEIRPGRYDEIINFNGKSVSLIGDSLDYPIVHSYQNDIDIITINTNDSYYQASIKNLLIRMNDASIFETSKFTILVLLFK